MTYRSAKHIHTVKAVKFIRRMKGGSQPYLLECDDGCKYVTKLQGNPQGTNVLANDWIGTAMARSVGLPVPPCAMVEVSQRFLDQSPDVLFHCAKRPESPKAGVHFGSFFLQPFNAFTRIFEHLTSSQIARVESGSPYVGITLFDLLTESDDKRQAVFCKEDYNPRITTTFIDFGSHFRGASWMRDSPRSGPFRYSLSRNPPLLKDRRLVDHWLARLHKKLPASLSYSISQVPKEWYEGDIDKMQAHYLRRIEAFPAILHSFMARTCPDTIQVPVSSEERIVV